MGRGPEKEERGDRDSQRGRETVSAMEACLQCRAEMLMYNGGGMSLLRRQALAQRRCKLWESLLAAPATVIGQRKLPAWLLSSLLSLFLLALFVTACVPPTACISMRLLQRPGFWVIR